ncbi:glycerol ethanol, ferric requiring protein [Geranomyces variabilis]|nr:glycerol ethanol, ferric requiring protein [Geranomyces variabilis]
MPSALFTRGSNVTGGPSESSSPNASSSRLGGSGEDFLADTSRRSSALETEMLNAGEQQEDADEEPEEDRVIYEDFTTIDWMKDLMRDYRRQSRMRSGHRPEDKWHRVQAVFEATQSWILISIIGISIGLVAGWIDVIAAWLGDIRFGYCSTEWHISKSICCTGQYDADATCEAWNDWSSVILRSRGWGFVNWIFYILFSTMFASACAFLVTRLAPYAAGSGSAEVKTILGGFIIKGFLGTKTLIVKAAGLPLMVASGLAVGKEGPMIHVACCVGNVFPRLFPKYWRNEARKREILSAASGAGIAVAFGAPIGGVLFSLEELSSFFPAKTMVRSFFCALVATVTLQLIDPYRGKRVLYQVTYSRPWHFFELIFFIILGVFGGLIGVLLISVNRRVQKFRKQSWLKLHPIYEVAALAAGTAFVCYLNIFTRVDSSDLLEGLFRECEEADFHGLCSRDRRGRIIALLVVALIMRIMLTTITFGIKIPAGIFIPSMVWGALFGRVLGMTVQSWQELTGTSILYRHDPSNTLFYSCPPDGSCVTPGVYAMLGAIGALGGVTRMTLSLTVVMFELTGTLNYIVPCMATLMTAKIVGDLFGKGGFAEMQIRMNRYPFLDPREDEVIGLTASEVMTPSAELVCFVVSGMTVADIEEALSQARYKGFPVLKSLDDLTLVGYISNEDLRHALERAKQQYGIFPTASVVFEDVLADYSGIRARRATGMSIEHAPFASAVSSSYFDAYSDANGAPRLHQGSSRRLLQLASFLDHSPLHVHPKVSIELDLFKKLGPRYVMVLHMGKLQGIITKKDILIAMYGEEEEQREDTGFPSFTTASLRSLISAEPTLSGSVSSLLGSHTPTASRRAGAASRARKLRSSEAFGSGTWGTAGGTNGSSRNSFEGSAAGERAAGEDGDFIPLGVRVLSGSGRASFEMK